MKTRLAACLLVVALPSGAGGAETAKRLDQPRVDGLTVRRLDGAVHVSFRVVNGLSAESLDRMRSGLPVTHGHRVELVGRRVLGLWPAKVHARVHIDTRAAYDSLTRRFDLTRTIRIGPRKKKAALVREEHRSTDSEEEVRAWMTVFTGLPGLEWPETNPGTRVKVKVESTLGRRFVLYVFPSKLAVAAERTLEP